MGIQKLARGAGLETDDVLQLCGVYYRLDAQRIDLNLRLMSLDAADPDRDVLWQSLEPLPKRFCEIIRKLSETPATDLSQLRAKAAILAKLLREHETESGQIVPQGEITALALGVADAVVGWNG